jgi:hypothetical protein
MRIAPHLVRVSLSFYMKLVFLVTFLSCNTVYSQTLEQFHSVNSTFKAEQQMSLSAPKDGQAVPSTKALASRYPQMPLEVDGYAVAPDNLQLEQVHIYVRHGAFLLLAQFSIPVISFLAL